MFHLTMTPQDVYVCITASVNRARMGRVCFDVAGENGNVKYACKVRTDMILWYSFRSAQ